MSFSSSTASRVFRGCRALLAPAKPAAAAAAGGADAAAAAAKASKAAAKPKPKKAASGGGGGEASPKAPSRPSGIQKVTPVSPALARFLNAGEASRVQAVKQIWAYIKREGLQDSINKREINCDERLKTLFEGREKVGFLEIGKLLSRHFVKTS
ncbi:upstream activation factor subunit spp27-like [Syzygium oleosum]|uniref:upstream activation factor subunit spp27-like n=1 Tax=Syzygium oleosum TaxID=219896 RepID=UPI0024BAEC00|nr:upstream activation factor subunit spp27-like [Syzygium oleosum]